MPQISHTLREIACPDGEAGVIVDVSGSVDPATIDEFDAIFDELIDNGHTRIVMNLDKLKYINSTGMGMMVQYYDQLVEEGGGLVLLAVQSKVMLVLEMLGLQELFPIVSTEEEAAEALLGGETGPSSIQVQLEEDGDEEGYTGYAPQQMTVVCGSCGAQLNTGGAGSYRCPRCFALIEIETGGAVQTNPQPALNTFELRVPADAKWYGQTNGLLAAVSARAGADKAAVKQLTDSVRGVLDLLTEHALKDYRKTQQLHLVAQAEKGRVVVQIFCGGNIIAEDESFDAHRAGVDSLELEVSKGGNLVTLIKKTA